MVKPGYALSLALAAVVVFGYPQNAPAQTPARQASPSPQSLNKLAEDFWAWRSRYQPYWSDDVPRLERPAGPRDWSAAAIAHQRTELSQFTRRWQEMDATTWPVPQQVDYRLIGSALARSRWELEINPRWQRDPMFYVHQTLTAFAETLLPPPPFDAARSREILTHMRNIPPILEQGKQNLRSPAAPFARLAVTSLKDIRSRLQQVERELGPMLTEDTPASASRIGDQFRAATERSITALESYRTWLEQRLPSMSSETAIGREKYVWFLRHVALLPYTPEQLLAMSRQEWERAVSFEAYEKQRNHDLPELPLASSLEAQIQRTTRDEPAIRHFLDRNGILTVPASVQHYTVLPVPGYLDALRNFVEQDDFTSEARLKENCVRWTYPPTPSLGYFALSAAKDPRPLIVHEGVPGHYFQFVLSWMNPDPIRRHYYDSGANEGLGFYAEEMMLQAGLFDDSPRTREIIYNFMRLRALRVEADVKLALGLFTIEQAADYLARTVPMDRRTATEEASAFAMMPGQAITYQIGKLQILRFLSDARLKQGDSFTLRAFHDFLWKNGNVPIVLQRWELLGLEDDLRALDAAGK